MKRLFSFMFGMGISVMAMMGQARFTSNTECVQLGQVKWKKPTDATFVITNTGNKPLVITDVETDCDCSVPTWTKEPIPPHMKGTISIRFDAAMLGRFVKNIAVYTNAQPHYVHLKISGDVVEKINDISGLNYTTIGKIAIEKGEIDFPDVHRDGKKEEMKLGIINTSDAPYEPVLMHLPPYITMTKQPEVLQKGEQGIITLTLDPKKLHGLGLSQSSVYLSRFMGDKVSEDNEIPLSVVLLPDFSKLTPSELQIAPDVQLSMEQIDMREAIQRKNKPSAIVMVKNVGAQPLVIKSLQVFHPAVALKLNKRVLGPGEEAKLKVMLNKKKIGKNKRRLRLLMITNSPKHPKVEMEIKTK